MLFGRSNHSGRIVQQGLFFAEQLDKIAGGFCEAIVFMEKGEIPIFECILLIDLTARLT